MIKRNFRAALCFALLTTPSVSLMVLPAAPAKASEDCEAKSGASYCYCLYNNALDELREQTGADSVSISKRIEIAKNALKQCLNRSSKELKDGVDGV